MKLIYHIVGVHQIVVVHVLIPKGYYQNIFIISPVCLSDMHQFLAPDIENIKPLFLAQGFS